MFRDLMDQFAWPGSMARRVSGAVAAIVVLALVSWGLMLVPFVNDAVLGDLPRDLKDFARMCESDGDGSGEPFPRADAYEPGAGMGPHPWVAIEDGRDQYSATGTESREPDWGEKPDPASVQLVVCTIRSGSVPDTTITCPYTDNLHGIGGTTQSVDFSQGRYTVTVFETRTGELVGSGTVVGHDDVECWSSVSAEHTGPFYTHPEWDAYAEVIADVTAAPPGR